LSGFQSSRAKRVAFSASIDGAFVNAAYTTYSYCPRKHLHRSDIYSSRAIRKSSPGRLFTWSI